jgi:acetylserotonin N-methyltransferase
VSAAYLCRSSPDSLAGYILYSNAALYALWGRLEDAVREGSHRWKQVFGTDGPLFAHFFRSDAALADFVAGMHGFGLLSSPAVVAAADLAPFSRMVDLGGATGHLARAALERYPGLRAVVFDLPEVVARVRGQAPPLDGRLEFVAGDFFRDALPSADLYALGRIVHDWGEERVGDLLARVHAALPPGGGLLLAERLLADDRSGPLPAQLQSLNMLVCTEGKERTEREYRALLEASGFTDVTCHRTGTPLDAIFAVKPPA